MYCLTYLAGSHHHATTDGVERVGSDTSTSGDGPAEQERGQEVTLEGTGENDRLERIVHAEVQTTVDDYAKNGGTETTVETSDTVGGKGLLVDIYETVELTVTALLGVLRVVGKTGTGVIEGVDEEEGRGTGSLSLLVGHKNCGFIVTYTTGGQVTGHPLGVTVTLLLEGEHRLVGIAESEVERLGREVTDDVGGVTTPQGEDALLLRGSSEALDNTIVLAVKTTGLQHLILRDDCGQRRRRNHQRIVCAEVPDSG
jgi:hypothetical protein